jgi:hypothetical protein
MVLDFGSGQSLSKRCAAAPPREIFISRIENRQLSGVSSFYEVK